MPGVANQREQRERDRHHDEGAGEDPAGADAVGERAADEPGDERGRGVRGDDQSRHTERDAAHVVQVDDQERPDHAVPEHVREAARLENPDVARKLRVQAAEVGPHRASLTTRADSDHVISPNHRGKTRSPARAGPRVRIQSPSGFAQSALRPSTVTSL
jgi:hypothetical protein